MRPDAARKVVTWSEATGPRGVEDAKQEATRKIFGAPGGIFEVSCRGHGGRGIETLGKPDDLRVIEESRGQERREARCRGCRRSRQAGC